MTDSQIEITEIQAARAIRKEEKCTLHDFDEVLLQASKGAWGTAEAHEALKELQHWCIELDIDTHYAVGHARIRQKLNVSKS